MFRAQRVRELFHACLEDPECEPLVWQHAPEVRAFFFRHTSPESFVASFDGDIKIWVSLQDHIESQIYFHEMQERDRGEIRLLKRLWRTGQVFFDVGANVGVFSLMAARRLGGSGHVHAFEPVGPTYERVLRNLALNGFGNVKANELGLSTREGAATMYVPSHRNLGMATPHAPHEAAGRPEGIGLTTLDRYMAEHSLDRIDLIKIDVEGHALEVLRGSRVTLETLRPIIVCGLSEAHLTRAGANQEALIRYLTDLSYRGFRIGEYGELAPVAELGVHENVVFFPDGWAGLNDLMVQWRS
jgi:FkbM family methyltransferase